MHRVLPLLCAPVLCCALSAQIPPAIVNTAAGNNSIPPDFSNLGANNWKDSAGNPIPLATIGQMALTDLGNGTWRVAATVTGVPAALHGGNGGGYDPLEGIYDPSQANPNITVVTNAGLASVAAIMHTGDDFALSISADGLRAVCDDGSQAGAPIYATRATTSGQFGTGALINNTVVAYADSKYAYFGGVEHFCWVDALGNIAHAPLVGGQIVGTPIQAIAVLGSQLHSHEAMKNAAGDCVAWICSVANGGDSDSLFVPGKDDTVDPPQIIYDEGEWQANPGQLGASGTTYWAHTDTNGYKVPLDLTMVAINGDSVSASAGGTLTHRVFIERSPNPWQVVMLIGAQSTPLAIPTTLGNKLAATPTGARPFGEFGLLPIGFVTLGGLVGPNAGGTDFSIPIAPNPSFAGQSASIQCAAVDIIGNRIFVGNTATIFFTP